MAETVLPFPPEAIAALEDIAKQTGRSRQELIQTAVQDFIQRNQQPSRPRSIGMGNSGRSDLSQQQVDRPNLRID